MFGVWRSCTCSLLRLQFLFSILVGFFSNFLLHELQQNENCNFSSIYSEIIKFYVFFLLWKSESTLERGLKWFFMFNKAAIVCLNISIFSVQILDELPRNYGKYIYSKIFSLHGLIQSELPILRWKFCYSKSQKIDISDSVMVSTEENSYPAHACHWIHHFPLHSLELSRGRRFCSFSNNFPCICDFPRASPWQLWNFIREKSSIFSFSFSAECSSLFRLSLLVQISDEKKEK